eukprot:m.28863 g.28863  ORF g.28863 m.28863 type:complete len:113 (-) comp11889_c0_seq1:308-646(-)
MYQHLSMFKEDVLAVHVWCHLMLVIVLNMSSSILPNRMRTPANKQKGQAIAVLVPNIQCLDTLSVLTSVLLGSTRIQPESQTCQFKASQQVPDKANGQVMMKLTNWVLFRSE